MRTLSKLTIKREWKRKDGSYGCHWEFSNKKAIDDIYKAAIKNNTLKLSDLEYQKSICKSNYKNMVVAAWIKQLLSEYLKTNE